MGAYKRQLEEMGSSLNLPEPTDWYGLLLRMPESMKSEQVSIGEDDEDAFFRACNEAIDSLIEFRRREGRKLYSFFIEKIGKDPAVA